MDVHHIDWGKWIPFLGKKEKNKIEPGEEPYEDVFEKDAAYKAGITYDPKIPNLK